MVNRRRSDDDHDGVHRNGAISIGNFDGVHRGHAVLLSQLRRMADRMGGAAIAVTFDPSPAAILRTSGAPPQLTTIDRRIELLKKCGVDEVLVCRTNRELLNQTATEFFQQLVVNQLAARGVVEGPNFYFGKNREGDTGLLRKLCQAQAIEFEIVEPQINDATIISSTRIRQLLTIGSIEEANQLLIAPYQLCGQVVQGAARGRTIGFPTANLAEIKTLIPGPGVYACRALLDDQRIVNAATHIGPNPTFADQAVKIEVHLLDYSGDLYGRQICINFVSKIRVIIKFESVVELKRQLVNDIETIRHRLHDIP